MFKAKVVLDSRAANGKRLISVEATYPRFIHSELLTHRDRARNSASSRAIPWKRLKPEYSKNLSPGNEDLKFSDEAYIDNCMYSMIAKTPVIPISFGKEQKGMQSGEELAGAELSEARKIWLRARDSALDYADSLANLGVHKSICNRLTEPFMWITTLITATEWKNFFRLRCHPAAEKHFYKIAWMIREAIIASQPNDLRTGWWHCPYLLNDEQIELYTAQGNNNKPVINKFKMISVGRCARLSYLTHDGKRDHSEDIKLAERLIKPPGDVDEEIMHASPFEHVAQAHEYSDFRSGPFIGWKQFRKEFVNENVEG